MATINLVRGMGSFFKECEHPESRWLRCPHEYKIRYRNAAGRQSQRKAERIQKYGPMQFEPYVEEWKAGQRHLGAASLRHLNSLLEHHLYPAFRSRRMGTFDHKVVEAFIQTMERNGVGLATQSNAPANSQGWDGGKRVKGRKRHIATDTLGLLLVLIVTAAGVQDSAGGKQVLDVLADRWPSVTKAWVDAGYNNAVVRHGTALGIDVEVVARDKEQKASSCSRSAGGRSRRSGSRPGTGGSTATTRSCRTGHAR
ncbi:transposase [Kitasatospora sp. NPDC059673]|uniref:transposase n=1 Tax=Kitasatospora sp. NPDC059673 TaxID=3346901 RepID=UPI0036C16E1E